MERPDIGAWYDQNRTQYQNLITTVERLLTTLLKEESIPYHSVGGRLKEKSSFLNKWDQKSYTAPEQIMDVAGLRIITHTTTEVQLVCTLIENEFLIDGKHSGDKAEKMEVNQVGYLSVHYIAKINDERLKLREYKRFKGLCFEIQVRSLLQHAWAEIEHDRSYKFSGVLPPEIKRKFYLVAGTLELMDQEFNALSRAIDDHAQEVREQTEKGKLDIPIDSTSLLQFLEEYFKDYNSANLACHYDTKNAKVIEELSDFGLTTLREVDMLLNQKTTAEWVVDGVANYTLILRTAMILQNPQKYFKLAWKEHWGSVNPPTMEYWTGLGINIDSLERFAMVKRIDSGSWIVSTGED